MTHRLFAMVTTAYILVAIQFEDLDLMRAHPEYAAYRRGVPTIVPALPRPQVPSTNAIRRGSALRGA